jgi:hypothetical protein
LIDTGSAVTPANRPSDDVDFHTLSGVSEPEDRPSSHR